jgi:hypothetical protein
MQGDQVAEPQQRRDEDLPVAVELSGALGEEVAAWVEAQAGWQVVAPEGPPAPAVSLVDQVDGRSSCVVVVEGETDLARTRAELLAGAVDVIAWPDERERLLEAPQRLRAGMEPATSGPAVFRIAGVAGGVGTSTVALALGGLLAWAGQAVVVVGGDDLLRLCGLAPWSGPGADELAELDPAGAAKEVDTLARAVAGVDGLRVLGGSGQAVGSAAGWGVGVVVADLGTVARHRGGGQPRGKAVRSAAGADLLVGTPDARLRAVEGETVCPAVVVGEGGLGKQGVRRMLGQAPVGWLASSARVARAGLVGRVPSGLPGSWLASLHEAITRVGPAGSSAPRVGAASNGDGGRSRSTGAAPSGAAPSGADSVGPPAVAGARR